jgi:hypothetical protein
MISQATSSSPTQQAPSTSGLADLEATWSSYRPTLAALQRLGAQGGVKSAVLLQRVLTNQALLTVQLRELRLSQREGVRGSALEKAVDSWRALRGLASQLIAADQLAGQLE